MSVTGQFTTFADLYTGVLNAIRAQTTQADPKSQAKRAVNVALQDMHLGTGPSFYWAERQSAFLTQAPITTGTVSLTQGSTSLVGTGTTWNTSDWYGVPIERHGKILIAGSTTPLEVTLVISDTEITLDRISHLATVTDVTYQYYKDQYSLASDYGRPIDVQFFDDNREIQLIDRRQLKRMDPRNSLTGRPKFATQIELGPLASTASRRRLVLYPPPDGAYKIPYSYITNKLVVSSAGSLQTEFSADTDEPIVPLQYRHAIYWYACKLAFQHKDDARRQEAEQEYTNIMTRLLNDTNPGDDRMRVEPRMGHYARHASAPYSGRGRFKRWSVNNEFDRLR